MTNKLVVFINSLKVPKIKKILLYEIKFLVPNYNPQEPLTRGLPPPDPRFSLSQLNLLNPPPPNKIHGYATDAHRNSPYKFENAASSMVYFTSSSVL